MIFFPAVRHLISDAERVTVASDEDVVTPQPTRPTDLRQADRNVFRKGQLCSVARTHGQDGAQTSGVSDGSRNQILMKFNNFGEN